MSVKRIITYHSAKFFLGGACKIHFLVFYIFSVLVLQYYLNMIKTIFVSVQVGERRQAHMNINTLREFILNLCRYFLK